MGNQDTPRSVQGVQSAAQREVRVTQPKDLENGDTFGNLRFIGKSAPPRGGYLFYEIVGLRTVRLHWQTVRWLLDVAPVVRVIEGTGSENSAEDRT